MKVIETHFIPYPQGRKSKTGKSNCQPNNTDYILRLKFPEVPESNFKVMKKHGNLIENS
jgi:hypothetical protein